MAKQESKLTLGKGTAFVKSRLKRLRQDDVTWEADFQALPKPMMQNETHYLGMVVTKADGLFLADTQTPGRPTVNDLATLLAHAMRRPLDGESHRPQRIHIRGHSQWRELIPHLNEIGIEVSVQQQLPKVKKAFKDYLQQAQKAARAKMVKPTIEQAAVEKLFPAIAKWVDGCGHIEIGDQQGFGFVVRALDYGGLVFEDEKAESLAEAMVALEKGLAEWFKEQES
ncbi:MAG: hypothetical protein K8U57_01915 [Planctomycetes bacterium]|nr:hypothetical protein [Planctomycetota bacterium]